MTVATDLRSLPDLLGAAVVDQALPPGDPGRGFDRLHLKRLFREALDHHALPSVAAHNALAQSGLDGELSSDPYIRRSLALKAEFYRDHLKATLDIIGSATAFHASDPRRMRFRLLAGDSHNRGRVPLYISTGESEWVLKFADPTPHLVLNAVLQQVRDQLRMPPNATDIEFDHSRRWYLTRYVDSQTEYGAHVARIFMYSVGIITAVAFVLGMIDLHLENVLVDGGVPVIIDPECIFYPFPAGERSSSMRLYSTGLVSAWSELSAIKGGDAVVQRVGAHLSIDSKVKYVRPSQSADNRLRLCGDKFASPTAFRNEIRQGFLDAYDAVLRRRDKLHGICLDLCAGRLRTRFLVRSTLHYSATIAMLDAPAVENYEIKAYRILKRFAMSGHWAPMDNADLLTCELHDLMCRDVPFFVVDDQGYLRHHKRDMPGFRVCGSVEERVARCFADLGPDDRRSAMEALDRFLS